MSVGQFLGMGVFPVEGTNEIWDCDVIEFEGVPWLVADWLDHPQEPKSKPARAICLAGRPYDQSPASPQFVVRDPIPMFVFRGPAQSAREAGFRVVEQPDVWVTLPSRMN